MRVRLSFIAGRGGGRRIYLDPPPSFPGAVVFFWFPLTGSQFSIVGPLRSVSDNWFPSVPLKIMWSSKYPSPPPSSTNNDWSQRITQTDGHLPCECGTRLLRLSADWRRFSECLPNQCCISWGETWGLTPASQCPKWSKCEVLPGRRGTIKHGNYSLLVCL